MQTHTDKSVCNLSGGLGANGEHSGSFSLLCYDFIENTSPSLRGTNSLHPFIDLETASSDLSSRSVGNRRGRQHNNGDLRTETPRDRAQGGTGFFYAVGCFP